MNRLALFVLCGLAAAALSVGGCVGCDKEQTSPITGQGGSGAGTTSSTTTGTGGQAPVYWVPGDPGTPGTPVRIGGGVPFAQGMTQRVPVTGASYTMAVDHCAAGGSGGTGGSTGSGGTLGAGGDVFDECPSSYVPAQPTIDLSRIGQTDAVLYMASPPVFQPVGSIQGDCPTEMEAISYGAIYRGDCTGVTTPIDVFTSADLVGFFGLDGNVLPPNTEIVMPGATNGAVRLISGVGISVAVSGDAVFAGSNVRAKLIQASPDPGNPGQWTRIDRDIGSRGISALMALASGKILFATNRTFDVGSFYAAGDISNPNPADILVQDQPILLKTFDPQTGAIEDFASISGTSRVIPQMCGQATNDPVTGDPLTCFFAGSANVLTPAQNGNILFSDRLNGKVYEIAADGSTVTLLFTVPDDVLVTGLTEAPNGIIYVVSSPTADFNCAAVKTYPKIWYWDANSQSLVEWSTLGDPEYASILPALKNTGVVERWLGIDTNFLGAGLFIGITSDTLGNLIVTSTLTGVTQAFPVIP